MARTAVRTMAIPTATTASAPPDTRREPAAEPARLDPGRSEHDRDHWQGAPDDRRDDEGRARGQCPGRRRQAGQRGDLDPEHEDERDRTAGPDGRVLPRALGGRRIGCQERIGRVRQPVQVKRPGQHGHRPDREDPREDRLAGRRQGERRRHRRTRRSRRPTGTPPHRSRPSSSGRTGSRVSRAIAARSDAPAPARRAAAAGAAGVVGGTSTPTLSSPRSAGGRGPDRRRTRPGCGRCRASSRADRRRRCGRRA